jgi:hypothetical protein
VVLGLKNLSGKPDEAWLFTARSKMLATKTFVNGHSRRRGAQALFPINIQGCAIYPPRPPARLLLSIYKEEESLA